LSIGAVGVGTKTLNKLLIALLLNAVLLMSQNVDSFASETSKTQTKIQDDKNSDSYLTDLQKRIDRSWILPPDCPVKKVVVLFIIEKDGQISHLRIGTSSGRAILDNAALKAVQNALPSAALPAQYGDSTGIYASFDSSQETGGKIVTIRRI
jgi:TonB family protein